MNRLTAMLVLCALPAVGFAAPLMPDSRTSPAEISLASSAPYYEPNIARISAGVPLRWRNETASPHSIRHDGCLTGGACAFQSPALAPSDHFMILPLPPGRYPYHCELHPIMRGLLIVLAPGTAGISPAGGLP